jgi:predicted transcriptional regulator
MKKLKFLQIHFQSFADFKAEVTQALVVRAPSIQKKERIFFDSVASFRHFMTIQKIELLTAIAVRKPTSIYELAQFVDRDFAAVLRDCTGLEATGFIKLKSTNDAKKSKVPQLKFDYCGIAIFLPKNPYQIEFKIAA